MSSAGDQNGRAPTILDVARRAGVSKSTVSRVLDERRRSQSPHADAVRRAAEELGYRRDGMASAMRGGRTGTVGVVVPRLTDTTMAMFYEAVSRVCLARDTLALVATSADHAAQARLAAQTLVARKVDGLVLATDRAGDPTFEWLREQGVPHVGALRSEGHGAAALGDDEHGAWLATRHLTDLGHESIALVNGPGYASNARGRLAGYRRALEDAGLTWRSSLVRETDFSVHSAAEQLADLLDSGAHFTACFCATDNLAIGAMSALAARGFRVPDDVSVVGYNDIPLAEHLLVPLTTVRVPFDEIAANALHLLQDEPDATASLYSEPELVVRGSTRRL